MKIIKALFFFTLVFIAFIGIVGSPGCANVIPPTGGPKDTLAPVLVSVVPRDSMLGFKSKVIVFTFDEYVQLKDKEKNIIINPTPKSVATIESKLKTVTVHIRDTLRDNTTYSIDFGNALGDFNEDNIVKNFVYVFSTGRYLDSLTFSGRVLIAKTGKADSTMVAMLYTNMDDSAVANGRPRYVARIDTSGYFTFHYLAPGTYRAYALKDEAGSRTYASRSQLFAFADSPVVIQQNTRPLMLFAYAEENVAKPSSKKSTSTAAAATTPAPKATLEKNKRLQLQVNVPSGEFDVLDTLKIQFATPIKGFDSTKFRFTDNDYKDITNYTLTLDSTKKKITMLYPWPLETKYHFIVDKEFAEDTLGKKMAKNDTISFQTKRESAYGSVRLRFRNFDASKNPVLQFIQSDAVKYSFRLKSAEFFLKLFQPGEYDLRVLFDDNKNGVWDPGDFFINHKQPEIVHRIKLPNAKPKLNVKANWDNEFRDLVL